MRKNNEMSLKKSVLYNSIGTFCYLFFQWLITFIIVWFSGYDDAGKFSIIMSICSTFYAISGWGMRNFQSSDLNGQYSEKSYLISRIITCIVGLICTFIYSLTLGYDSYLILCINVYMIFKTSEAIVDVLHGSLQKKWLFNVIGLSFLLRGFISICIFTIVLVISKSLLLSIIFMVIATYLIIYFYDISKYRKNIISYGKTNFKSIKKLLYVCIPLVILTFVTNYIVAYPRIVVKDILGTEKLGIYTTFANPALIIQVAASFIFTPLVTLFADLYKKKNIKGFSKVFLKTFFGTLLLGTLGYFVSSFLGKAIMTLCFGKTIAPYSYLLNEVIIVSTLTAIIWLLNSVLTVMRKMFVLISGSIIGLIIVFLQIRNFINDYSLSGVNRLLIIIYVIMILLDLIVIIYNLRKVGNMNERKNI